MKSHSEGMRSLFFYIGMLEDMIKVSKDEAEKEKYNGLIDVLIPVAKGYVTDKAFEMCGIGIEVFGGYGYTKEYPQEQLLRDCKITKIYEGTNGIQAMDLLGRKLFINKGQSFKDLLDQMQTLANSAKGFANLKDLSIKLENTLTKLKDVAQHMATTLRSEKMMNVFAYAHPFLDVTGDTIMAWMLLWRASVAAQKLEQKVKSKDAAFYEGQLKSAQFFINTVLPSAMGKMDAIFESDSSIVDIQEASFAST
jgi:hypothetical protein